MNIFELIPGYFTQKGLTSNIKASILQKEVDKESEEISNRRTSLMNLAKETTDKELQKQYLEQAINIKNYSLDELDKVIKEAPTAKQIVASSSELALTLAGGSALKALSGGYKTMKSGQLASKTAISTQKFLDINKANIAREAFNKASNLQKTLTVGKSIIGSALEGATYGALGDLTLNKESNTQSLLQSAALGGVLGGGLNVLGRGIGAGLSKLQEQSPKIEKAYNTFKTKLDEFSSGKLKESSAYNKVANQIEGKKTTAQALASKTVRFLDEVEQTTSRFFDRFDALKKVEDTLYKIAGKPISKEERVYEQVRLVNAISDDLTTREGDYLKTKLTPFMKNNKNLEEESSVYLLSLDNLDRAKNGQLLREVDGKTVKVSEEEAINELAEIRAKMASEGKLEDMEAIRKIWKEQTDNELSKMQKAGLISEAEVVAIKEAHPNYIPHNVIMEKQGDSFLKSSLNVGKSGINKAIGSVKKIKNPYNAYMARTQILNRTIQQNKLIGNLINTSKKYKLDGFKAIQTAENITRKNELIAKLKETKTPLNKFKRELNSVKRLDKKTNSSIKKLQDELDLTANMFADEVANFANKKDLDKLYKKQESIGNKLEDYLDINKPSVEDANKFLTKSINELKKARSDMYNKALSLSKKQLGSSEETINFFNNGIKETWVAPKDVVEAIKGTGIVPHSAIFKMAANATKTFKMLTTTLNPSFALPNKFRDEQTAMLTANALIQTMAKKTGVSPRIVNLTGKELDDLYKKSGGIGGSIYQDGDEVIFKELQEKGFNKFVKDGEELLKILPNFLEQTTRKKVFENALRAGLDPETAALVSRDATIDFSKMGTVMQSLNQVIPFLNARIQGFANLGTAIKNNPEMFMRTQMLTSVYPAMALDKWNNQWDSYKNISQDIKNKYWLIVVDEVETTNENGDKITIPQFITVPKGEGQTLIANPIQYYLESARKIDNRSVVKMLVDTLGSASPLEFQKFSTNNPLLFGLSQFGVTGSLLGGYLTGKNPYFGSDITSQYQTGANEPENYAKFTNSTPEYLKGIAKLLANPDEDKMAQGLDLSPAYIDFTINSLGGIPQSLNKLAELVYGITTGEKSSKQKTDTGFGAATQIPVVDRFAKEATPYYSPAIEEEREGLEKITKEVATKKVLRTEELDNAVKDFVEAKNSGDYDVETLKEYWNNYIIGSYNLTEEEKSTVWKKSVEVIKGIASGRVGALSNSMSVEVRARGYYEQYKKIRNEEGIEAAKQYEQECKDKGILTKDVWNFMTSPDFKK